MVKLSLFEQILVSTAVGFLTALSTLVTNQIELAGIQAAITFLQRLLAGQVASV